MLYSHRERKEERTKKYINKRRPRRELLFSLSFGYRQIPQRIVPVNLTASLLQVFFFFFPFFFCLENYATGFFFLLLLFTDPEKKRGNKKCASGIYTCVPISPESASPPQNLIK